MVQPTSQPCFLLERNASCHIAGISCRAFAPCGKHGGEDSWEMMAVAAWGAVMYRLEHEVLVIEDSGGANRGAIEPREKYVSEAVGSTDVWRTWGSASAAKLMAAAHWHFCFPRLGFVNSNTWAPSDIRKICGGRVTPCDVPQESNLFQVDVLKRIFGSMYIWQPCILCGTSWGHPVRRRRFYAVGHHQRNVGQARRAIG